MIIPVYFAQCNLKFSGAAVPTGAEVTFGLGGTGASGFPTDIAQTVLTALLDSTVLTNLDSNVLLEEIAIKKGPNVDGAFGAISTNNSGSVTGTGQSPNTAFLITKNTSTGGRKGRGRFYWPGVASNQITESGIINGSTHTAIQSDFSSFLGKLTAADVPMVLLHTDLTAPNVVTSLTLQARVATQRRRLRR